jgi:type IV secretory pathway VirD2 relaxase
MRAAAGLSAEDGGEYPDLKPFVRRLMTKVEDDLGTRLDWVAVDHFNTGHPHTHIMLRGVDDQGHDLIIAREYISRGLRERATELVTVDLGPRTDQEIESRLRHDIGEERLTAIDRRLLRSMDGDRQVGQGDADPLYQALRAGRLQALKRLGLAQEIGGGRWQLVEGLEDTLKALGERGDIIRTMQREMTARALDREGVGTRIHAGSEPGSAPIVGKVIMRGLEDEHRDRHLVLVDGIDGQVHYVALGRGETIEPTPEGSVVRITPAISGIREVDRTIAQVSRDNGGLYSIDAHLRHDRAASESFSDELGLDFSEARQGERIEGVVKQTVEMVSGRYAVIGRAHDFTLVPWRPTLERQIGKPVSGIVREAGTSWSIGRERDGPSIG